MRKTLVIFGVAAPILYVLAVVLGGALRPGYSHLSRFVSELLESGAPNKEILNPLFGLYNLLVLAFAVVLARVIRTPGGSARRSLGIAGALVLVLEGLFGFVTLFFPQDPVGTPMSGTGTMHIVLAGASSLASMASLFLLGLWLRRLAPGLGTYTLVSLGFVFVTGGIAAAGAAGGGPLSGLLERLTIGGFLQWLLVTGIVLPRRLPPAS